MKDKQTKYPQLRFKGFTDPWEQHKLGEVVEMFNGDRGINYPKNNDLVPEGVPFINAGDLQNGQVNLESCKKISKEKFNQLSGAKIRRGDILYCLRGTIGKNALVEFDKGTVASSLVDIRPKNIDRMYLFIILNSNIEYRQRLLNDEGAAQPNLSVRNLSKFYIPVPQTKEQHKISVFFKSFNELLTLHQRKLAKLKELKQGYLQKLFPKNGAKVPELRFAGFADDWEERKLGDVFSERSERSGEGELISVTINSGVVKASELYRKDNSSDDKSNYKKVEVGDIAYNSMRMWQGASGYSPYNGILSPAYTVIIPKEGNDSKFLAYDFKRYDMIQTFKRNSQGLTSDTWNLKFPTLKSVKVMVPSLEEQQRISTFFESLDTTITLHQRKLEKLQELKKGYLQKMFCWFLIWSNLGSYETPWLNFYCAWSTLNSPV